MIQLRTLICLVSFLSFSFLVFISPSPFLFVPFLVVASAENLIWKSNVLN